MPESKLNSMKEMRQLQTDLLSIAFLDCGDSSGWPCILCHGFPYDVECYRECIEPLVDAGAHVIVPWLRGYGPTTFRTAAIPRSGEQAALAHDLLSLMDGLTLQKAVLAGFDWGGRAACIVAALWPDRVAALISGNSYNIQNIAKSGEPEDPSREAAYWYQYYFHSERGRRGLSENRRELARLLWQQWSPTWTFPDAVFEKTASSFDNPDFVEVVIHSYRHRFGLAVGDPHVAHIESRLINQPVIEVPTIAIDGETNGVSPNTAHHRSKFTGPYEYREFANTGHNLPQERPELWVRAILDAKRMSEEHK